MNFQDVILSLQRFWADRGCVKFRGHPYLFFKVSAPDAGDFLINGKYVFENRFIIDN